MRVAAPAEDNPVVARDVVTHRNAVVASHGSSHCPVVGERAHNRRAISSYLCCALGYEA
jgi:hypothetical protein